jgi:hypothetical protein
VKILDRVMMAKQATVGENFVGDLVRSQPPRSAKTLAGLARATTPHSEYYHALRSGDAIGSQLQDELHSAQANSNYVQQHMYPWDSQELAEGRYGPSRDEDYAHLTAMRQAAGLTKPRDLRLPPATSAHPPAAGGLRDAWKGLPLAGQIGLGVGGLGLGVAAGYGLHRLLHRKPEKQAAAEPGAFAGSFVDALQEAHVPELRSQAFNDMKNIGMLSLGVGAAGRGGYGLLQMLRANRAKKTRSGPQSLPLPYPVAEEKVGGIGKQIGDFFGGSEASDKTGLPFYGPAMVGTGLAGLGAGWKGMDMLLGERRKQEAETELEAARQQFHSALLGQYAKPKALPAAKTAADETMCKVGEALEALAEKVSGVGDLIDRVSNIDTGNLAGQAASGYGTYALLSGLGTGALVYNKMQGRSRRAILEKALQARQRQQSEQRPTEIYATPEPMPAQPAASASIAGG